MIRRFVCISWIFLLAVPAGAADGDPLPKDLVGAWQKANITTGWMGTARDNGTLFHSN